MTWIKICGTTNLEDALMSVEAGADALGFVFYEKSPRYIPPDKAREIIQRLPDNIEKLGVFVNCPRHQMEDIVKTAALTGTQIHLNVLEEDESFQRLKLSVPRKFFVLPSSYFEADSNFALSVKKAESAGWVDGFFLDSGTPEKPGGTGKVFDWINAVPIARVIHKSGLKVVVAGGLNPDNVAEAIRILDPWGVDVVSGVEASPGKKDPQKVRAFISAVRRPEKSA